MLQFRTLQIVTILQNDFILQSYRFYIICISAFSSNFSWQMEFIAFCSISETPTQKRKSGISMTGSQ